jgi:hypothetical protein
VNRPAILPAAPQDARPLRARQVPVAPALERAQHHRELAPGRGELVGIPRPAAGLPVRDLLHHPRLDQRGQARTQDVRGHAELLPELLEARGPEERLAHDQEGPALAEHAQAPCDRAGLVLGDPTHAAHRS